MEPGVIGTLTGNLGARHGTCSKARGAVRRGATGPENKGRIQVGLHSPGERRLSSQGM